MPVPAVPPARSSRRRSTSSTQQTGIKVKYVQGTTSVNYAKVVAEKAHPSVDVLEINPSDLVKGAAQGLFDKINAQEVPAVADLYPATPASEYGVPQHIAVEGFAYNSQKFAAAGIPPLDEDVRHLQPEVEGPRRDVPAERQLRHRRPGACWPRPTAAPRATLRPASPP